MQGKSRETSLLERDNKNNHGGNSNTYKKPIEALYDIFFDREEFFVQYINPLCKNIILLALLLLYLLFVFLCAFLIWLRFLNLSNPTATLLEHTLLTQGFTGTSKAAFPRRL